MVKCANCGKNIKITKSVYEFPLLSTIVGTFVFCSWKCKELFRKKSLNEIDKENLPNSKEIMELRERFRNDCTL